MNVRKDYFEKGATHFIVTNEMAEPAVKSTNRYVSLTKAAGLEKIPCPGVENGKYSLHAFREEKQWLTEDDENGEDTWVTVSPDRICYPVRYIIVLKEQAEEGALQNQLFDQVKKCMRYKRSTEQVEGKELIVSPELLRLLLDFRLDKEALTGTVKEVREWLFKRSENTALLGHYTKIKNE